ncbi:PREDICTED: uncharacterized protein LOC107881154 [Prunus mume]|uniref:Uncharacterized protein LOC107881154 n=1 Tax=Prunus mume TaxID=102107 RepID=A0ABM1LQT1_PRUMU|nr:PREDICTED: uncharacterized protein LOC107881154 [Prunus mume]
MGEISQFSVAAVDEHTSGQMAFSCQDEILGKISQIEKTVGQLLDWSKSITQEFGLLRHGPAITTTKPLPPSAVFEDCNSDHEADDFYPSLPEDWEQTSMTVYQEEARSVCLFVSSCEDRECTNLVYEVKFTHRGEVKHEPPVVRQVAKFHEGFCLNAARIFNHSKLYCIGQDSGFIVDTRSWSKCSSLPPIPSSNLLENIVCAYGKVYYLACSSPFSPITGHSFGRYNPDHKVWEQMTSFPFYDDYDLTMEMTGYAVCYGVILFSLSGLKDESFSVVAFHVGRRDWNRVKIDTSAHCAPLFEGRVMVVNETIYALYGDAKIKAFSFIGEQCDVNGISYSLRQLFVVQGLDIARPLLPWFNEMTHYLVHLGNHDFFYVQTGKCDSHPKVQYLSITTFEIVLGKGGKHMIKIIDSFVHSVDIKGSEWFNLVFCFTPECDDYEPIEVL